jgi:integrase
VRGRTVKRVRLGRGRCCCFVEHVAAWPHTLRHSAAAGWLEAGVHIKAVADLLGDSSISITGDIYGHTSGETARSAVYGWSGVLGL